MVKINNKSLYLIISEEYGEGRSALEIARSAIAGGVDIIQMREKDKTKDEQLLLGKELSCLCKEKGVTFIVNDDPFLARKVDADGVHLGQEDLNRFSVEEARSILGKGKIIGLSTSSIDEVEKANKQNIDYIGFGPVFPTVLKENCVGTKDIKKVTVLAKKPVFFIGGINLSNLDGLLALGARNIALIRAVLEAGDIESAAKAFKARLSEVKGGQVTRTGKDTSGIF